MDKNEEKSFQKSFKVQSLSKRRRFKNYRTFAIRDFFRYRHCAIKTRQSAQGSN